MEPAHNPGEHGITVAEPNAATVAAAFAEIPAALLEVLCLKAETASCGLTEPEFGQALEAAGAKANYGLPQGAAATAGQREAFFRGLHVADLALARACALGREPAWERFLNSYREALVRAAQGITGSASLGEELADSLYAELYGLREVEGERKSPLASFTGRGSLMGWLRVTLAQRFTDHHRRTHREAPLEDFDAPAAAPEMPAAAGTSQVSEAVARTLAEIDAEDRYLLAAYYLDRQTLLKIARVLNVHEATISRRLKRLLEGLRTRLLKNLAAAGLSRAAAIEALGTDVRDIEINLRGLLQSSQVEAFKKQEGANPEAGRAEINQAADTA